MKVRVQRIGRSLDYPFHKIDTTLMEATVRGQIQPGKELSFHFTRLSDGVWYTTKVVKIEYAGKIKMVHTKNSIYMVVDGWERDDEID